MKKLTIAEYAEKNGISKQAIYKNIKAGKLKTEEKEIDGKKVKIIIEETETEKETTENKPYEEIKQQSYDERKILIDTLINQIKEKDTQINEYIEQLKTKDKQIDTLTEIINHTQMLQGHTQMLLEENTNENKNEPNERKKSIFDKLKELIF